MKKILILVMSHDGDDIFRHYKKIWDQKNNILKDKYPIDVLFLYSDNKLTEEYELQGNCLISKCDENYWQALLTKTINGFKHFIKHDYDLVFKTNLSTFINVDKFYNYCSTLNCGDFIYEGCVGKYSDYSFCSGAGMLLNKKTVQIVLDNVDKIDDRWTDDIFIGYVLNKLNNIQPSQNGLNRYDILNDFKLTDEIKNYTHIRVKVRNGDGDIRQSNRIFEIIYGLSV